MAENIPRGSYKILYALCNFFSDDHKILKLHTVLPYLLHLNQDCRFQLGKSSAVFRCIEHLASKFPKPFFHIHICRKQLQNGIINGYYLKKEIMNTFYKQIYLKDNNNLIVVLVNVIF